MEAHRLLRCLLAMAPLLLLVGCAAGAPAATPTAAVVATQATPVPSPQSAVTPKPMPPAAPVVLPTPQSQGGTRQWDASGHYYKGNPAAKVVLEEWTSVP